VTFVHGSARETGGLRERDRYERGRHFLNDRHR
jgi:hypothetical protein